MTQDLWELIPADFHLELSEEFDTSVIHYLATPYSQYPGGPGAAYRFAALAQCGMLNIGITCISPILNYHSAEALSVSRDGGWDKYAVHDMRLLLACHSLIFVDIGMVSYTSAGMRAEYDHMRRLARPIWLWEPKAKSLRLCPISFNPWEIHKEAI
jgi:hypothetical protein